MQKTMKRTLLVAFLCAIAPFSASWASPDCIKGITKVDMCAKARALSDEIASMLPMKMSQNMSWESVMAAGTTIQAHIRLSYDKKYLENMYNQTGLPLVHAKQAVQQSAQNVCREKTPTRAFINLGGSFTYVYFFIDGEQFTTVQVNSCN